MFDKFRKIMKLREKDHVDDDDWNAQLEANGGLEKHDFLAMVIAAMIIIVPVCLVILLIIVLLSCLFLL